MAEKTTYLEYVTLKLDLKALEKVGMRVSKCECVGSGLNPDFIVLEIASPTPTTNALNPAMDMSGIDEAAQEILEIHTAKRIFRERIAAVMFR